jgi:hypothetical protein
MASIAMVLNQSGQRPASDLVVKFLEHFAAIRDALASQGLWDEADGLYYDRLVTSSGYSVSVKVRSMVSIIPALAAIVIEEDDLRHTLMVGKQFADLLGREGLDEPDKLRERGVLRGETGEQRLLLSIVGPDRLERLLARLFDESEFLSSHGLRALSAYHREHPYVIDVESVHASIDYEPAESTTPMFGGNSNWRGPVWFPLNYLLITVLERYHRFFGGDYTVEYPTGSGRRLSLDQIAADLSDRLISIFTEDPHGRRACFGGTELMQTDPAWHDNLIFSEYFHGDNGAAIGAFHQTGWTGLIADVIRRRHGEVDSVGDVIRRVSGLRDGRPVVRPRRRLRGVQRQAQGLGDLLGGIERAWGAHDRRDRDQDILGLIDGHAGLDGGADVHQIRGWRRVHRGERGQPHEDERGRVQVAPLERYRVDVGQRLQHRRFSLGHRLAPFR